MKICIKCNQSKVRLDYHKASGTKDGLRGDCKACRKEASSIYYQTNKDSQRESREAYRVSNLHRHREYSKAYVRNNPESRRKSSKKYQKNNKDKVNNITARYRATKLNATPKWSEKDKIKVLYEKAEWLEALTGLKYHVDHIIPLRGKNVSGLHVWYNLQILEESINISKGNKHECN